MGELSSKQEGGGDVQGGGRLMLQLSGLVVTQRLKPQSARIGYAPLLSAVSAACRPAAVSRSTFLSLNVSYTRDR